MITKRIRLWDILMLIYGDSLGSTPISVITDNGIPLSIDNGNEIYSVSEFVDDDFSSICEDISVVKLDHTSDYIEIIISGIEYQTAITQ